MNRQIKFRVWDIMFSNDPKMINWETLIKRAPLLKDGFNENEAVLMQWSGLLDKHGKEIYEGDIVETQSVTGKNRFIVKFGQVQRNIVAHGRLDSFPAEISCFYFEKDGLPFFRITANFKGGHDKDIMEVIGNIFENPELWSAK
jgi:uncharacterized phage protein (TIGR01671 family)